jgi:hypothetical protein
MEIAYNISQYKDKFHPTKSGRTVRRMVSSGLIPSYHLGFKNGRDWIVINLGYFEAYKEFQNKKHLTTDLELLATVLSVKYKIDKAIFFVYIGF